MTRSWLTKPSQTQPPITAIKVVLNYGAGEEPVVVDMPVKGAAKLVPDEENDEHRL